MAETGISIRNGSTAQASMTLGHLNVTDIVFPPNLTLPSHYHLRACFALILEGSVDKTFRMGSYPSPAATLVTMPPEERHADRFERGGARLLVIEPADTGDELLLPCAGVLDRIHHYQDAALERLAWRAARELALPDAVSPLVIEGLALEMLALAARRASGPPARRRPPPWLTAAEEFLRANALQTINLRQVAAASGVHPVHLARTFRQVYGVTPGQYVRALRLDWAAAQLAAPSPAAEATLASLAQQAGFSDQSHFTRAFKRHTGRTPAQYRALARPA